MDSKDKKGATSLSFAARFGREAITQLLLEEGANPESENGKGETPSSLAARNGHAAVFF